MFKTKSAFYASFIKSGISPKLFIVNVSMAHICSLQPFNLPFLCFPSLFFFLKNVSFNITVINQLRKSFLVIWARSGHVLNGNPEN